MNNRIKQLSEQACVHAITTKSMEDIADGCYVVSPDQLQQFAELIVRECAYLADNQEDYLSAKIIKQHFGVEE